eukprot:151699-Pleurochrysis_carterae.AAC.6
MMLIVAEYYEGLMDAHRGAQAVAAPTAASTSASAVTGGRRVRAVAASRQSGAGAGPLCTWVAVGQKKAEEMPWKEAFDPRQRRGANAGRNRCLPLQLARNQNSIAADWNSLSVSPTDSTAHTTRTGRSSPAPRRSFSSAISGDTA